MAKPYQLEPGQVVQSQWPIKLTVNGVDRMIWCHPAARLSDVLRDGLGLTGTKVGCNAGDCGACTVLLDTRQVCACLTSVAQAEGHVVQTVEGLSEEGQLSALQQAFLAHGATQCGICTSGMLMAASDLLARHPNPTEQEVLDGLGGVLCRCTGYRKIVEAVLAASQGNVHAADAPAGQAVGSRQAKLDGIPKVTGVEKYGADQAPSASLWLRVIRSPHARATFTLGDFSVLKAKHPGLVEVMSAADVPENSFGIFPDVKDQPVLAHGQVRFPGEAVIGLVGEYEAVMTIAEAELPIAWHPEEPVTEITAALHPSAPPVHAGVPENILCQGRVVKGDVNQAFSDAPFVAEGEFETSYIEHAYIEPEAGYAERFVENGVDRIRIFACTQTPYMDRDEVARVLKIKPEQVHIVPSAIGGGFGGKLDIALQPLIAVAAWKLGQPVKCAYTRSESMRSTTKRHPGKMRARFACDREGKLIAADFQGDFNTGAYASWGNTVATRVPIHACGPSVVPNVRALTRAVYINGPIAGAFRGFGVPQSTIVCEALIDELAERSGIDQLEFRHRNALRVGEPTATGQVLRASCGLAQCLDRLRPAWSEAKVRVKAINDLAHHRFGALKGKRRGLGIACMWYGIGSTVMANPSTMRVALRQNGRLFLYNGAVDIGQGSNTILPQVCADALGLPVTLIDQVMGDTDVTADAGKTSASRQAFVSGNAAKLAGADLRKKLLSLLGTGPSAVLRLEGATLIADAAGEQRHLDLTALPADRNGDVALGEGSSTRRLSR